MDLLSPMQGLSIAHVQIVLNAQQETNSEAIRQSLEAENSKDKPILLQKLRSTNDFNGKALRLSPAMCNSGPLRLGCSHG